MVDFGMRRGLRVFGGALVVAGGALLTAIACGPGDLAYLTEGDGEATEPPPDDTPNDPCKHARPPKPPPKKDVPTHLTITFATREMRLDTGRDPESGLSKPQGLDLDNTCTCGVADAAPSCNSPATAPPACDKTTAVDGGVLEEGRDNVAGDLLAIALSRLPVSLGADAIRDRIGRGLYSILVGIADWNGTPDDDQVFVSMLMSPGADMGRDENMDIIRPKWDGNDRWAVEVGSVQDGMTKLDKECESADPNALPECDPIAIDLNGYVSGGKLVANFDEVPFSFGDDNARLDVPFQSATLVAKITGTAPTFYLDGELSGRWPADKIVNAIGNIAIVDDKDPEGGVKGLCTTNDTFEFFRKSVCLSVDLASTKADDNKGKDCRTMSQSVRFKAEVAHQGAVRQSAQSTHPELCPKDRPLDCSDFWK